MTAILRPADHAERMEQAWARARWELGDGSWAQVIVDAYLNPDDDRDLLRKDMDMQE